MHVCVTYILLCMKYRESRTSAVVTVGVNKQKKKKKKKKIRLQIRNIGHSDIFFQASICDTATANFLPNSHLFQVKVTTTKE